MRHHRPIVGILVLIGALAPCFQRARAEGDPAAPRSPGKDDVCPVCGMVVAPHRAWVAQAVLGDGSVLFFDGCKDLFKYLLARDRYAPDRRSVPIAAVYVTSYYDVEPIPARSAFFVVGSDVLGPMGPELVPHPDRGAVDEFLADHGGSGVVRFEEVSEELLRGLRPGTGAKK